MPPGETIADLIEKRGYSQGDLARRLGYTLKRMSLLIDGKASITEEIALKLENVLGSTGRLLVEDGSTVSRRFSSEQRSKVGTSKKIPERLGVADGILGIGASHGCCKPTQNLKAVNLESASNQAK